MRIEAKRIALALGLAAALALPAAADHHKEGEKKGEGKWISLFNGKDLTGWTPKFRGEKLGVNHKNTFRVVDGLLTVSYDQWDDFGAKFGHLFYKDSFSHYRLRAEYRFIGKQVNGGPGWALRNNGLMLHGQDPATMGLGQDFPNSIEVQLLGGGEGGERSTANLCTPGTHVFYKDPRKEGDVWKLDKRHCISSQSKTFRGDQWVVCEVEVKGSEYFKHYINGELVMHYEKPQLNDGTLLEKGTISIQAESHPTQFRKIEILVLED